MKLNFQKNIIILYAIIMSTYTNAQTDCNNNPVENHGNLSVSGNKIVDQNNNAVSFAGNSMFWSNTGWGAEDYYSSEIVSWLKKDWGTTIVRAAMGVEDSGGYISDATANKNRVKTVVNAAIAQGIYVIIDWHSHGAENYEQEAIDFFKEMATLYGNYPNVIYEIYNEPIYSSWSNAIKPYAESVISQIRAIDPDNLIIVGTPTWSQDVDIASNDPITSSTNIAYTLHFYAGTHGASLRAKAQTALNNGIALMVTEWGTVSASGDGSVDSNSTDEWMAFLAKNDISHANWSINDKSEGASILKSGASKSGNWSDSNLTTSGLKVKSIIEEWKTYCNGQVIVPAPVTYVSIPKKIEAEDFDTATEGRTETNGNITNIGYIDTDESLSYNINVPTNGGYTINFRVASETENSLFDIYQGTSKVGSISTSATGGWQTWKTVSTSVNLSAGKSVFKIVATGSSWNIDWMEFYQEQETTLDIFTPDPNKKYYIDSPVHNLRLAATGESEDAYTTSTTTTGTDVEWSFVSKGNGYWHLQRAAGGSKPRLRTDNSVNADMNATSSSATFTYYEIAKGASNNTYFFTLPHGPIYKRLQINDSGDVKMVTRASNGTWESFTITDVANAKGVINTKETITNTIEKTNTYPNPFTNTIHITTETDDLITLILMDITGNIIKEETTNTNTSLNNLDNLANGIYFLQIINTKTQTIKTQKLIKL